MKKKIEVLRGFTESDKNLRFRFVEISEQFLEWKNVRKRKRQVINSNSVEKLHETFALSMSFLKPTQIKLLARVLLMKSIARAKV